MLSRSSQEREFLSGYEDLGSEEARVSVVLPGSARRLVSDSDGYVLFSLVILRRFERALQTACRENRYTMRLFDPAEMRESGPAESEEVELAKYEVEEKKIKSDLLQWCRPNYSELVSEWVHLKALRVYVESILRYGLHAPTYSFVVFVGIAERCDVAQGEDRHQALRHAEHAFCRTGRKC